MDAWLHYKGSTTQSIPCASIHLHQSQSLSFIRFFTLSLIIFEAQANIVMHSIRQFSSLLAVGSLLGLASGAPAKRDTGPSVGSGYKTYDISSQEIVNGTVQVVGGPFPAGMCFNQLVSLITSLTVSESQAKLVA